MDESTPLRFDVGDGAASATVLRWLVPEGTSVNAGDPLVELEWDKATVEIPAPRGGILVRVQAAEGIDVARGETLAWIADDISGSVASRLEFLNIRMHGRCPACGARIAINGPWQSVRCGTCGTSTPLPQTVWTEAFDAAIRNQEHLQIGTRTWDLIVSAQRGSPQCHNCETELAFDPDTPLHSIVCTTCGLAHDAKPPPPWLVEFDPRILRVLGDLTPVPAAVPERCPHCNTSVHPRTNTLVPRCSNCGRDIGTAQRPAVPRRWSVARGPAA